MSHTRTPTGRPREVTDEGSPALTEDVAIITFAALAIVFIALTSPVSGHAIARSARRRGRPVPGATDAGEDEPD